MFLHMIKANARHRIVSGQSRKLENRRSFTKRNVRKMLTNLEMMGELKAMKKRPRRQNPIPKHKFGRGASLFPEEEQ